MIKASGYKDKEAIKDFGRRLEQLIKQHGMTRQGIADRLGVTNQAVTSYINGRAWPRGSVMMRLTSLFNVTLDYLMTGDNTVIKADLGLGSETIAKLSRYNFTNPAFMEFIDSLVSDERLLNLYNETVRVHKNGITRGSEAWAYDLIRDYIAEEIGKDTRKFVEGCIKERLQCGMPKNRRL